MAPERRTGISLALLSTFVLAGVVLAVAVSLFVMFDRILVAQVRDDVRRESAALADSAANTIAKLLWNFDDEGIRTLGDEVYRNPIVLSVEIRNDQDHAVFMAIRPGKPFERIRLPAFYQTRWTGSVILVTSADEVSARTNAFEAPASWAGTLLFVIVLAITPLVMGATVLSPFRRLGRRLESVDPQSLSEDAFTSTSRIREVRAVESALRTLAGAVRENLQTLEQRVEDRTAALRSAQTRLVHAEALATAGRLAAGVSHELNTPLAAMLSSARTLRSDLLGDLVAFAGEGAEFQQLLEQAAAWSPVLDVRRDRQARNDLRGPWTQSGRDPETTFFDLMGTHALMPLVPALLSWTPGGRRDQALRQVLLLSRFLAIIEESADRGSRVVQALSGQLDRSDTEPAIWFDGAKALDRCLVLHQTRAGEQIEVRKNYVDGLTLFGTEGLLSQVWLSLVTNAFQAVGTSGWVEVGAKILPGEAEVWVADSGPPVSAAVQTLLFEPYVTTKSGGLGLGLSLSRTIVESQGGQLVYQEEGGKKAFVVRWPQPVRSPHQPRKKHEGSEG